MVGSLSSCTKILYLSQKSLGIYGSNRSSLWTIITRGKPMSLPGFFRIKVPLFWVLVISRLCRAKRV